MLIAHDNIKRIIYYPHCIQEFLLHKILCKLEPYTLPHHEQNFKTKLYLNAATNNNSQIMLKNNALNTFLPCFLISVCEIAGKCDMQLWNKVASEH